MRAPLDAAPLASVEAAAPVFEAAEFEFVVDVASMIDSDSCSQSNGFDKWRFDVWLLPHTSDTVNNFFCFALYVEYFVESMLQF